MTKVLSASPDMQLTLRAGLRYLHRRKTVLNHLIRSLERYGRVARPGYHRKSRGKLG